MVLNFIEKFLVLCRELPEEGRICFYYQMNSYNVFNFYIEIEKGSEMLLIAIGHFFFS